MYANELKPGLLLKKSPFLIVRDLDNNEVRAYSKLHGNLTSFNFNINLVFDVFSSKIGFETALKKLPEICECDAGSLIKELYDKRFVIENDLNEKDMLLDYAGSARDKYKIPKITKVNFLISARCNLACKGCYHNFYDFKSADMNGDLAGDILDGLFPFLRKRGVPALLISFFGYEPLANFTTLSAIYDRAGRLGEKYDINTTFKIFTNAYNLTDKIHKWIKLNKSRIGIKVSLDGIKEDHDRRRVDLAGRGTYDRVIDNLKRIITTGAECGVITVLSKLNHLNIEKFVDEMAGIGIGNITANIFCGHSADERLMELTEPEKFEAIRRMDLATEKYGIEFDGEWKYAVTQMVTGAQFYCPAGLRQLAFSADGAVYPCQRFAGTDENFGIYKKNFWDNLLEGRCENYNSWTADLYSGVIERTDKEETDLAGWSCPFLPFLRGECISKNLDRELNNKLMEYFVTRPINRIITEPPANYYSNNRI